jgi:hypothetical protein
MASRKVTGPPPLPFPAPVLEESAMIISGPF